MPRRTQSHTHSHSLRLGLVAWIRWDKGGMGSEPCTHGFALFSLGGFHAKAQLCAASQLRWPCLAAGVEEVPCLCSLRISVGFLWPREKKRFWRSALLSSLEEERKKNPFHWLAIPRPFSSDPRPPPASLYKRSSQCHVETCKSSPLMGDF